MKRIVALLLAVLLTAVVAGAALAEESADVRVASLKGPTSMGLVKLMQDNDAGSVDQSYSFTLSGTADEIVPLLTRGELDIAMVPCNLASVLYNNTKGQVRLLAVNTLGVLYIVENGESINTVADLAGKTIYSTGKGTTPEFALNYILAKNGLDASKDVTIEYKSEATEVLAALTADAAAVGVLPQPYVTAALMQNESLRIALSLSDEWDKVSDGSRMITGVAVARAAFVEEHPEAVAAFMKDYAASIEYVNANPSEAAQWVVDLGIVAKAPIAEKALPGCNIVYIDGEEMKTAVSGYLEALYEQEPKSVGGALPDEAFYYIP